MKRTILFIAAIAAMSLPFGGDYVSAIGAAQDAIKKPDVVVLGKEAKLGTITFSHSNHTTKNYNLAGTGPIACIVCHHTAQPASALAGDPLLKTSWPADRTTTLTEELFDKDPSAAGVAGCHECHARAGTAPTLIPANPTIPSADGSSTITVTNQLAFHRNCANCHAEVLKVRKDAKCPTPQQCSKCHNRE